MLQFPMKILNHYEMPLPDYYDQFKEMMDSFLVDFRDSFGRGINAEDKHLAANACMMQFGYVLYALGGEFKGKRILDLGCGSNSGNDNYFIPRSFEPWFCRFMHYIGAEPIGFDIGDNSRESFINYRIDLAKPDSLDKIADSSVDVVSAKQFFTSPFMHDVMNYEPQHVEEVLLPQIERVLKPGSYYVRLNY